MKVMHVITKLELGGAQVNTVYTYEHLNRNSFEAWLISGPGGILTDKVKEKDHLIIIDELVRPINPWNDFKAYLRLKKIFKEIKPDIVHTHSSKAGILGRLAARAAGVPVIIHSVHGFSFSPFQSFVKRNLFIAAEKWVAKKTTEFIFVSSDDIDTAKEKKLIKGNYSLIRSGFPFEKFQKRSTGTAAQRAVYSLEPEDKVCGIIAPFKPQKGLFHLIEIASRVIMGLKKRNQDNNTTAKISTNVRFIITGDGALRPQIEEKLKEKGIWDYFRLPGFVFDIENAIDTFDIGMSTALWEGLPQSLVQLRLKKKAVVASDIPGNREVIRHGKNGFLVDVKDYDGFSEKVIQLLTDRALCQQLSEYSEEDFSDWNADHMVKVQEELYVTLLNRKKL